MKIFSSILLHFKKCFEKYFLVFGCILENTIENTSFTYYSHFLSFQTIISYYFSIYKHKRNKTQQKKKNLSNPAVKGKRDRLAVENDGGQERWQERRYR